MQTILELLSSLPGLLAPGASLHLPLPGVPPVVIEFLGEGPRNFPAIAVTIFEVQDGLTLAHPRMEFEVSVIERKATSMTPYRYADKMTGQTLDAVRTNGVNELDMQIVSQINRYALALDELLRQHGIRAAFTINPPPLE